MVLAGGLRSTGGVVLAQYDGGEETLVLIVDKKIRSSSDGLILDNFDKSQKIFIEGGTIEFIVRVENNGQTEKTNVKVVDKLPLYLKLLFYPGTYNSEKREIEWIIDKLAAGESKTYNIRAFISGVPEEYTVASPKQLTNVVLIDNDSDEAKYFVASKSVPVTGNQDLMTKSLVSLTLVIAGFGLRKLARGY